MGIYEHLNTELSSLNEWFTANDEHQVNAFHRRTCDKHRNTAYMIANETLERVQMTKFIGVVIYEHLTWEHHNNHCAKSILKVVSMVSICLGML